MILSILAAACLGSEPLSFEFVHNEILIKVMVQGKGPYTAMLDTGTSPCVVDSAAAKELDMKLGSSGLGSGGGTGHAVFQSSRLDGCQVGPIYEKHLEALVTDLQSIGKRLGRRINLILGDNFFRGQTIQIDYPRHLIRFGQVQPGALCKRSLRLEDHEAHIDGVTINGTKILGNIDTGSSGVVSLTPKGILRLRLTSQASQGATTTGAGFNGSYERHTGILDELGIGPATMKKAPVDFWAKGTGHDDSHFDANIGNAFFKSYVVTLDYKHRIFALGH